jgi:hypothetical protein
MDITDVYQLFHHIAIRAKYFKTAKLQPTLELVLNLFHFHATCLKIKLDTIATVKGCPWPNYMRPINTNIRAYLHIPNV